MSKSETKALLPVSSDAIPGIAEHIKARYQNAFDVKVDYKENGICEVNMIEKLAMYKNTLCVKLEPYGTSYVSFHAMFLDQYVSIFRHIFMLFIPLNWFNAAAISAHIDAWYRQIKLDDQALQVVQSYLGLSGSDLRTPPPAPQPTPHSTPKPAPKPAPQPTSKPAPQPAQTPRRSGNEVVMQIEKVTVFGGAALLLGVCQSEVAVGDMVKVVSLDGSLVIVDQVQGVQSFSISVSKSKPGSQTVLELRGSNSHMIKDGTVYHK